MKSAQLSRIFAIIKILLRKRYPASIDNIAKELEEMDFEVPSRRTLFRDIEKLEELGYTLSSERGKGYSLHNRHEVATTIFTDDMVQALQMSRNVFDYFAGTTFKESIDESLDIITGTTRQDMSSGRFAELESNFTVHLGPHRNFTEKRDILDEIINSVNASYAVQITYKKGREEMKEILLEPYRIVLYKDSLYLIARAENESVLKTYHISRILEAEQSEHSFKKDEELLEAYDERLSNSFGIMCTGDLKTVRLTFDPSVSDAVKERIWHDSQIIRENDEGVTLTLRVLENFELVGWILSWGKKITHIEPESLEKLVASQK